MEEELRDAWGQRFGYSSLSWLMETSATEVLDMLKRDPTLEEVVKGCIRRHILKHQHQPQDNDRQVASS